MSGKARNKGFTLVAALMLTIGFSSCSNNQVPSGGSGKVTSSCEICHTNYDMLVVVADTATPPPVGGCGGEAPYYPPYDRVILAGDGYDAFKTSGHYSVGCTGCHNGNDEPDARMEADPSTISYELGRELVGIAHSDKWTRSPSLIHEDKCAMCHSTQSHGFTTSIHNGTGQKRKVAMRAGIDVQPGMVQEAFEQLPENHQEAYVGKCAVCHGTCGNCHVVRPAIKGGGLEDNHNFIKTPDWYNVCVGCHVSRGGHAFLGTGWSDAVDTTSVVPDVHRKDGNFTCLNCHDGMELHGDGNPVDQRYEYAELPTCTGCHEALASDLPTSNDYHSKHYEDFQCQICHSQPYNTCGACHVADGHAEYGPYADFKIAMNPIPELKEHRLALVRRTLASPDNWTGYGDELAYENFDVLPTYNYTTPHNIIRWTRYTKPSVEGKCGSSCHIRMDGNDTINKDIYLMTDDLLDWEIGATADICVDDELPSSWFAAGNGQN